MSPGSTSSRLHAPQGLGVAGVGRARGLGLGQFLADVARQIFVGRLPVFRLRVAVDQVAEFLDDRVLGLAVELAI